MICKIITFGFIEQKSIILYEIFISKIYCGLVTYLRTFVTHYLDVECWRKGVISRNKNDRNVCSLSRLVQVFHGKLYDSDTLNNLNYQNSVIRRLIQWDDICMNNLGSRQFTGRHRRGRIQWISWIWSLLQNNRQ